MSRSYQPQPALPPPEISLTRDSPELARTYDRVSTRQLDHGKLLVGELGLKAGERVLDVGCGTGRLAQHVAELVGPDGIVSGVDPLPLRVEIATSKHPRVRASVGRAEDLSEFQSDSFDAAYLNSVLHWLVDKPRSLAEVFRVLKPGGRLAVNSANADRNHQSGNLVREALLEEGLNKAAHASAQGTQFRLNASALSWLLRDAGFKHTQIRAHTFIDTIGGVDELFAWSTSSSFGNFLSQLAPDELGRVRARVADKLETLRTSDGIKLARYLVFATAEKG